MKIVDVLGYELLDSRGNPTVGAKIVTENGVFGFAISPSGASTGMYEAHELRDGDTDRYFGKGVQKAVNNINTKIREAIVGIDLGNQKIIDDILISLDNSSNKINLGANATLAVSMAAAHASANSLNIPLFRYLGGENALTMPRPMMNILNGGAHAGNNIDIQEFMIIPTQCESFAEGLKQCVEVYHTLGKILKENNMMTGVGDEGGFAPNLSTDEQAIELILEAASKAGYKDKIKIALDAATSEWYKEDSYYLPKRKVNMNSEELINYFEDLVEKYPIVSIEDALAENDWEGWRLLTERLGKRIQLVGDDLFVTNVSRLKIGLDKKAGNSILIKPNQIGTLSETLAVINLAKNNGYNTIISHRSGETEDTTISDLAVAVNAGQIKTGAPCRTDRVAKYNRLLQIENML